MGPPNATKRDGPLRAYSDVNAAAILAVMSNSTRTAKGWLLAAIIAAVSLWGAYHAVGAFHSENALRGFIVLGFFLAFLGFWAVLLLRLTKRRSRIEKQREEQPLSDQK